MYFVKCAPLALRLALSFILVNTLIACSGGSSSDDTPNAITLVEITGAALNKSIESDSVTISGIDTSVGVSITGGEYAIDNGSFTSAAGTISNGQSLKVRLTSANALNQSTSLTITVSDVSAVFTVTTRSVDAAGLYTGSGTVNSGTALNDVTGMIYDDRLMLFSEAQNVLYDGQISGITNGDISANITVYKDGVNNQNAGATGNISGTTLSLTLSGTDFGSGTLSLTADTLEFANGATNARFASQSPDTWGGSANTVSNTNNFGLRAAPTDNLFSANTTSPSGCVYTEETKTIPDGAVNIYIVNFNVTLGTSCNHLGNDYTGLATTTLAGASPAANDTMWFAASNGTNSTFSILTFIE